MKKFTVFYDQRNRTNYQVLAKDEREAIFKGNRLYKKYFNIPPAEVQEEWIKENDGEDK